MFRVGNLKAFMNWHRMHHHHISQWHWAGKLCFTYTTATLLFLDYVRCNLILLHILFICLCSPEELSPIENKRSPDTREACVLCIPALACPALCVFLSPSTLFGALETKKKKQKNIPGGQTVDVMSLLSSPVYRLPLPWFPCRVVWYLACCATGSPLLWCHFCSTSLSKSRKRIWKWWGTPKCLILTNPLTELPPPMESTYSCVCTDSAP